MSAHCYDLAVIAVVFALLLLAAICGLCVHIRNSVLGARLLEACAGDRKSAAIAIENVRTENELLGELITRGLAVKRIVPWDVQ